MHFEIWVRTHETPALLTNTLARARRQTTGQASGRITAAVRFTAASYADPGQALSGVIRRGAVPVAEVPAVALRQ
eukprot:1795545-Prymnesium_polylepis.1